MWKEFGSGVKTKMAGLFSNVKEDASKVVDTVVGSARDTADGGLDADRRTQVYTWKDASGMTHYSNVPADAVVGAQKISVDPDRNLTATVRTSTSLKVRQENQTASREGDAGLNAASISTSTRINTSRSTDKQYIDANKREVAELLGGQLPGVAGQKSALPSVNDGGFSPAQLLKMLQQ